MKKTLRQEFNDILDKMSDLNQKAVKQKNSKIKNITCYLLEIAESHGFIK